MAQRGPEVVDPYPSGSSKRLNFGDDHAPHLNEQAPQLSLEGLLL